MIHALVTVKPSKRFPGKNGKLWNYTFIWLLAEAAALRELVRIYLVGDAGEIPDVPPCVRVLPHLTGSHRGDIEAAEADIAPAAEDVLVLAQLTEPLRERGLLPRVVNAAREQGGSAITATTAAPGTWREVTPNGAWHGELRGNDSAPLHDGGLYAWLPGHAADIFNPAAPHGVVLRNTPLVDIDEPSDLPPALPAMWAEKLL